VAVRVPAATGWLAAVSLAGFALVALAARAGPARGGSDPVAGARGKPSTVVSTETLVDKCPNSGVAASLQPHRCRPPGNSSFPTPPWLLLGLLAAGALLVAAIWLVVLLGPRLPGWRWRGRPRHAPRRPTEPAPDDLAGQVSDSFAATLAGLTGGQVRDAVILLWHRLEQTADAAGLRRSPADTSSELAERLLATLPVSPEPLHRLAALYREARFSSHPIPDAAVARARADLVQVRSELSRRPAGTGAGRG
jgi:hypothetical protein